MLRNPIHVAVTAALALGLVACGGGGGGGSYAGSGSPPPPSSPPPPPPAVVSYLGTTGVFAAWADPTSGAFQFAATNSYAGKRQSLRGTLDFMTGANLGQPAGVEIYKGGDGHI